MTAPQTAGPASLRILYIAGSGRSGSTLLANILGQVEGVIDVGELRFLWERGVLENRLCGCGRPFAECPLWGAVSRRAFGADTVPDAEHAIASQATQTRLRKLPALLASAQRSDRLTPPSDHADRLVRLYRAVAAETGSQVVVDSSKLPSYGYLLERIPEFDVRVVHLTRDPRAAAYSWRRKKVQPDRRVPGFMTPQGLVKSSMLWSVWNAGAGRLWRRHRDRYVHVRYEDFVANPKAVLERILQVAGLDGSALPLVDDHTVDLRPNHTVAGNPDRLKHGAVTIREDDEWKRKMSSRDRLLVTSLTLPLLRRYGYSGRPRPDLPDVRSTAGVRSG